MLRANPRRKNHAASADPVVAAPLVSVITATYNWSAALRISIPSVINQRFTNWELIVVGDGCTDESEQVVTGFADNRIRWVNLERNTGSQSLPNNRGIELARGELIAYLGHDDMWSADHLESLLALYHAQEDFFAAAGIVWFDADARPHLVTGLPATTAAVHRIFDTRPVTSGVMHSRRVAGKAGQWRDWRSITDAPDHEFFTRIQRISGPALRSNQITVAKVSSTRRKNVYRTKDVSPQIDVALKLRSNPHYLRDAAILFLLESYPRTLPGFLASLAGWCRVTFNDSGGRELKELIKRAVFREKYPGRHIGRTRRFRGAG